MSLQSSKLRQESVKRGSDKVEDYLPVVVEEILLHLIGVLAIRGELASGNTRI